MEWFRKEAGPLIIGHRGAAGLALENTLPAFQLALNLGVDALECDVQLTADGRVLVFHDDTLARLTGLRGKVADYSHDELLRSARVLQTERIPLLEDVFSLLSADQAAIFVEIKDPAAAPAFIELASRISFPRRVLVGSFSLPTVRELVASGLWPIIQLAKKLSSLESQLIEGISAVGLGGGVPSPDAVQKLQQSGVAVWLWTINRRGQMKAAFSAGVDGIITDRPDLAMHLRDQVC